MIKIPCIKDAEKLEQWIRDRSDEELKELWYSHNHITDDQWMLVDNELIGRGLIE